MKNNIEDRLLNIFNIIFSEDYVKINNKISMKNNKNWDSLKHLNLILAIEEEFNFKLSIEEISSSNNFLSIMKIIRKKNKLLC